MAKSNNQKTANGSNLDFEAQLWAAADKMRGHMDASEYKILRSANTNCSNRRVNRDFSLSASNNVPRSRERERVVADRVRDVGEKHSFAEMAGVRCRIPRNADSFRADLHPDLKADLVPVRKDLANPPFNMSDWCGENLRQDVRCFSLSASNGERAGVRCRIRSSPVNNANYAWIQHFIHHLSPVGVAGFVMANDSM